MIQCCSTCHLQTKSPAPSDAWGWGCADMGGQGHPALGTAGLSPPPPLPQEGGKYSCDQVTDEEMGSGRSRLTEAGSWVGALGLPVPSVCFAPDSTVWVSVIMTLLFPGPSQILDAGCNPLTC